MRGSNPKASRANIVESVEQEFNFMSDWIDRLKEQRDKTSADQQLEREINLRDAQMIESKLPDFWRSVVDETEAQAARLSHVFPSTPGYATEFSRTKDGFVMRQLHGRHLEVTATLDMGSRRVKIDLKESSPQSRPYYNEMAGKLTENGEVSLRHQSEETVFTRPQDAAEWFVKTVCAIPETKR